MNDHKQAFHLKVFRAILTVALLISVQVKAQRQPSLNDRIETVYNNIYSHFYDSGKAVFTEKTVLKADEKPYAYLWPVCALIQAANEIETLDPTKKYMRPVVAVVDKYYSRDKAPHAGYDSYPVEFGGGDRFYDDNQWIGIAYLDAYLRTSEPGYLQLAREIYEFMLTGYDTASGGGLYWKEFDKATKNTCSNGPGIIMALQLYKATNEKKYLDTAMLLYDWVDKYLLAPGNLYYDNIRLPSGIIDKRKYTYNAGTMLQSNVLLYQITSEKKYLARAKAIAAASLQFFYKNGSYPDNYWFNAVLLRGFIDLYKVDKERKYCDSFVHYADEVWKTQRDTNNLIGATAIKSLIDQAGYLEILARLQNIP